MHVLGLGEVKSGVQLGVVTDGATGKRSAVLHTERALVATIYRMH